MPRRLSLLAAVLLAALAAAPATAGAAATPVSAWERGVSDARLGYDPNPLVPPAALQVVRGLGGTVARLPVHWRGYIHGRTRPAGDLRDPAHPAYRLDAIDANVKRAVAQGLDPLLYVLAAPAWAELPGRWRFAAGGTWAPDPRALADFGAALARRYDGTYPDPKVPGATLPRVRRFQPWNEPNLPNYLQPQWVARGRRWEPFAALWYRRMQTAFTDAVHTAQPGAQVGTAGVAPVGESRDGTGRTAPTRFWHAFLCLEPPPSTRGIPCTDPPRFDAIALHPLSVGDPDRRARSRLDFAIADVGKVQRAVAAARRQGGVASGSSERLWITELNWESGAAPRVPAADQARYVSRGLHRLWRAGAELVLWHFVTDPAVRLDGRERPAGLTHRLPSGVPGPAKPFARAFAFPLTADRIGPREVLLWSDLPAEAAGASVVVERRHAGSWTPLATLRGARPGPAEHRIRLARGAALRLRVGARTSPAATVGAG